MRIAVTAVGSTPDAQVDPRFGRTPYYLIYDTENQDYEAVANPGIQSAHGAGVQGAQLMLDREVKIVLTGRVGPNAYQILHASGIEMRACPLGSVAQAIKVFHQGDLPQIEGAGPAHGGQRRQGNR